MVTLALTDRTISTICFTSDPSSLIRSQHVTSGEPALGPKSCGLTSRGISEQDTYAMIGCNFLDDWIRQPDQEALDAMTTKCVKGCIILLALR